MIARMASRSSSRQVRMLVMNRPRFARMSATRMAASARRVLNRIAGLACSGDSRVVTPGRYAELPDEGARHVALVGETRQKRGISWGPACGQQPSGETHSVLDEIGVWRRPDFAGEATQQLEPAYT